MYDPNQPRIPEGHHGGGRWTRGGYGFLSDVGKRRMPSEHPDDAPRALDEWDREPDDLRLLSDLDRLRPERGDQYAFAGGFRPPPTQTSWSNLLSQIGAALTSAVAAFEAWSRRDNGDRQTFATFRAREFVADERGLVILPEHVQTLDRQTVIDEHCPRLKVVEDLLDETLKDHPQDKGETNSNYGIRIHKLLEWKIKNSPKNKKYKGLKVEVSITDDKDEVKYGTKGSVRLDILEDLGNGTACVYDYKIGKFAILSPGRMLDIANKKFAAQNARNAAQNEPKTITDSTRIWRIVVTQVKPGQGKSRGRDR
jgi:hypothetical protein